MNPTFTACFATVAQAFLSCSANAAAVMPIWQNDTAANTISFQDTFGHQVSIGTYNPATGVWSVPTSSLSISETFTGGLISVAGSPASGGGTFALTVAGTSGGIPYFPSGTTWASSAALGANQLVVGGGAGVAPSTPVGLGTTTQVLHGNAAGAPTFGAIVSADVSTVLASPPAIGNTAANTGAFTTLSSSGLATLNSLSVTNLATVNSLSVINTATLTGQIAYNPVTNSANGVVPGIFEQYAATGSLGAATSGAVNAFNLTSDTLAMNDPVSLAVLSVNDAAFGGAAAKGGRIISFSAFTQTAASESTHTFRSYVGNQSAINTTSGDGGGSGTEKGDYYGYWSTNIIGASATHVKSQQGMEIDLTALAAPLYKSGLLIGGAALGSADASQGTTVDTLIWLTHCTTCVGAKVGIQFGRPDGFGGVGISATGTLIATAVETATIGSGIDLTGGGNTTITNNAWASPGALITGAGLFASSGSTAAGFQVTGTKSTTGFYEGSTAPYGMQLIGTYSTASWYATTKPDFHYAPTVSTCAQVGQLPVLINGVAHNLMYC